MVNLNDIALQLVAKGKGILAADESNSSADKRLALYGIAVGEAMRLQDRTLFLGTEGLEKYLTGVILYEETLGQNNTDGLSFPQSLLKRGIIPGIKVDQGLEPFPESPEESITKGLIGLGDRLRVFVDNHQTGFTKWRAVIKIDGTRLPTSTAIVENCKRLAMYAVEVQKAGMVPMLEPEVLLEGTHSRLRSQEVLTQVLHVLVAQLEDQAVDMTGVIVKTAMAISGKESGKKDTPEEVAESTVAALMETIPAAVPGIVFLSGGQETEEATENLRAIVKLARERKAPWTLTFSYARALQDEALTIWAGKEENVPKAREAFLSRLDKVSEALG